MYFLDLTNNITNIFRKFVADGKCTISFKLPEVDLQIKADPIQLKAFLNVMKNEMFPPQEPDKKEVLKTDNKLVRAFGSTVKPLEILTKMTIKERSALPSSGFPRTLKELTVTTIKCAQMPIGILNLTNLFSLDLSKNQITKLPKALGNLKLKKLILNENRFGESVKQADWEWLDGENIRKSLKVLSISKNGLKFMPSNICRCLNIENLNVSQNEITRISFAIKVMSQLKTLSICNNKLSSLPCTLKMLRFDAIDLASNEFQPEYGVNRTVQMKHRSLVHECRAPTLLELSARAIIKHRIPFMTHNIPQITKDILFHAPVCANPKCEILCIDRPTHQGISSIDLNSKEVTTSDGTNYFLADGPFCCLYCQLAVFRDFLPRPSIRQFAQPRR